MLERVNGIHLRDIEHGKQIVEDAADIGVDLTAQQSDWSFDVTIALDRTYHGNRFVEVVGKHLR